ncbi:UbiA prenyltransferase family-domain-containing protein [Obelidium mucronatum]|nr:UbiA prenyltransferase family-domain-containing protein [Obelidium mucronatum]
MLRCIPLAPSIRIHAPWRPRFLPLSTRTAATPATVKLQELVPNANTKLEPIPDYFHKLHPKLIPYLRLARVDRPAGSYLLFLPGSWSIAMASYSLLSVEPTIHIMLGMTKMMTLFGVGAFVMRGAGCTVNDMWDSDLDKKVDRTRSRPLASGQLNYLQAWSFLGLQLSIGLAILTQLNWFSILLGASSLSLVVIYPLMKRITYWPQAVLGLAFNWGALLGWSAITGGLNLSVAVPLYLSGWCWTIVYDTIYAVQDKNDDVHAGVKSTALLFGDNIKPILTAFSVASTGLLALAGYMNEQGAIFYAVSVLGAAAHYMWMIGGFNINSRTDAASRFRGAKWFGWVVLAGVLLDFAGHAFQSFIS